MKSFLKIFFSSCLGTIFGLLALGFCGFFVLAGCLYFAVDHAEALQGEQLIPSSNTILRLNLSTGLVEHPSDALLDQIDFETLQMKESMGLDALLVTLEKAQFDARIDGLFIDIQGYTGQWSQKNELRRALQKFRDSGKWIVAYSETYGMEEYYLASVANQVFMGPKGDIELNGIGMEFMFFGRLLKKLGIEVEILKGRDNDYKSAVEPFSREQMSAENREQLEALLHDFWGNICSDIERSRSLDMGKIDDFVNNYQPANPSAAVELGLADNLLYRDEMLAYLCDMTGVDEDDGPQFMSLVNYGKGQEIFPLPNQDEAESGSVAVLLAQGTIVSDAYASQDSITPSGIRAQLNEIRQNKNISALVLRIDSPGGDALAAESIWKELDRFRKAKPLIVSMGPTVASGGYYMACAANVIIADPMTLTGSIGVFGLIPKIDNFLSEQLDITVDRVHTHPDLGGTGVLSPMSEGRRLDLQGEVDQIYDTFLTRVSTGRSMSMDQVRKVARGRIWSGKDALEQGLVDQLGGLSESIEVAKSLVGSETEVVYYGNGGIKKWMGLSRELVHMNVFSWYGKQFPYSQIQMRQTFDFSQNGQF